MAKGPIKAAAVGDIKAAGGVAKAILELSRSDDLDLRCSRLGGLWTANAGRVGMKCPVGG